MKASEFKISTDANQELGLPEIGWEQDEYLFAEERTEYYRMLGYSDDGREWEGSAGYFYNEIEEWPDLKEVREIIKE